MMKSQSKLRTPVFLLPILVSLFFIRGFLFEKGIILYAEFVGSTDYLFHFKNLLHAWSDYRNLGTSNLGWPQNVGGEDVFGTVTKGGTFYWLGFLSFLQILLGEWGHKIYFLVALILPFFTFYPLAKHLFKEKSAVFLAAFVYFLNPQILTRVQVGTLRFNLAYALLPLLFLIYLRLKEAPRVGIPLILGGGLIAAFIFQIMPHFLIIFGFLAGLDFVYTLIKNKKQLGGVRPFLSGLLGIGILMFLINSFILLPELLYPEVRITQLRQFFSLGSLTFNGQGATLPKILTLTGWPWPILRGERAALSWPEYLTVTYPLLAILGLTLGILRKKVEVKFWALSALFFLFLAKGVNAPLVGISKLLYLNLPFLWPFRDPTKFLAATAFCFAILSGYFLLSLRSQRIRRLVLPLAVILFFASNLNFLDGFFEKTVVTVNPPDSYKELATLPQTLQKENLMVLPNGVGLSNYEWYPDSQNPSVNYLPFSSLLPIQGNFTNSLLTLDTLSSRFLGFLENHLGEGKVSELLLKKAGVQLLAVDQNIRTTSLVYPKAVLAQEQLKKLNLGRVWENYNLTVFESGDTNPYFYTTEKAIFVVGDLNAYGQIGGLNSAYLQYPFIFLNQFNNFERIKSSELPGEIVFANTQKEDLIGFLLLKDGFGVDLAKKVWNNLDSKKEWALAEPYLGQKIFEQGLDFQSGGAIGTSGDPARLFFQKKIEHDQKYRLFVRPNFSPQAGGLKVLIDNKVVFEINLKTEELTTLKWLDLGPFDLKEGEHRFGLITKDSGEVLLDGFLIVPETGFAKTLKQIDDFLAQYQVDFLYSAEFVKSFPKFSAKQIIKIPPVGEVGKPEITYTKQSPARYELKLEVKQPTYLVFKQNFSPYWEFREGNSKVSPLVADYFANAFYLPPGQFDGIIYHTPDKIYRGLVIFSVLIIFLTVVVLIKSKWESNY